MENGDSNNDENRHDPTRVTYTSEENGHVATHVAYIINTNPRDQERFGPTHFDHTVNTNANQPGAMFYNDHRQFILHRLNHTTCPHGRDLPPEQRQCGICHEAIHPSSTVAQICPTSHLHTYHWLCMIQWVTTWNAELEEYNRNCPSCRAALLIIGATETDGVPEPDAWVCEHRRTIARGWDDVVAARGRMFAAAPMGWLMPPVDEYTVDRALPTRYALDRASAVELPITLMALGDPMQVEAMRSAAYMTSERRALKALLAVVNWLRLSLGFNELIPAEVEESDTDMPEAEEAGEGEPGEGESEEGESEEGESDDDEPEGESDDDEPGEGESDDDEPEEGDPEDGESGESDVEMSQTEEAEEMDADGMDADEMEADEAESQQSESQQPESQQPESQQQESQGLECPPTPGRDSQGSGFPEWVNIYPEQQ